MVELASTKPILFYAFARTDGKEKLVLKVCIDMRFSFLFFLHFLLHLCKVGDFTFEICTMLS